MKNVSAHNAYGILGTVLFHAVLMLILFLVTFSRPEIPEDGEGILVQIGMTDEAQGELDPSLTAPAPTEKPASEQNEELDKTLTQNTEKSITITPKEPIKKATTEKLSPATPEPPKEDPRIRNLVDNAFNKGLTGNGSSGNSPSGTGAQGSPGGNASSGAASGSAGYGNYDLGGRGIVGTLPRPQYDNSNDEGTIVVSITVNPEGKVIEASMGRGSTGLAASNATLREQAVNAAKRAVFTASNRPGNQNGTITYYFRQR